MLEDETLQTSHWCTKFLHFVFSSLHLLTGVRHHALHHSPGKLGKEQRQNQTSTEQECRQKKKSSVSETTMRYHRAERTAAEHCSLGIRMLGMQRFINSLQIGPKEIEIP